MNFGWEPNWRGSSKEAWECLADLGYFPDHVGQVVMWATGQEPSPIPMRHVPKHGGHGPPWAVEMRVPPDRWAKRYGEPMPEFASRSGE
jgi:hypothetical protein